jgi:asparaginyl-tRNA synthetase
VYCFGPAFRAEKSKTRRHLIEFWMMEPEWAFATLDDVIALEERLLVTPWRACSSAARGSQGRRARTCAAREGAAAVPAHPLQRRGEAPARRGQPFEWGGDFGGPDETVLAQQFETPCSSRTIRRR